MEQSRPVYVFPALLDILPQSAVEIHMPGNGTILRDGWVNYNLMR